MIFKIPQKTVVLWEIRVFLIAVVFWGILFFYAKMNYTVNLIFMFLLTIICVFIPFYLKSFEIRIENTRIEIKSGIIIKTEHILPNKALIYGEAFATPLARVFRLSAVALKGARHLIVIPELEKKDTEIIISGEKNEKRV